MFVVVRTFTSRTRTPRRGRRVVHSQLGTLEKWKTRVRFRRRCLYADGGGEKRQICKLDRVLGFRTSIIPNACNGCAQWR